MILKAKSSYIDQLPIPIGVLSCGGFAEPWRPPLPPFPTPKNRTLQKVIVKSDDRKNTMSFRFFFYDNECPSEAIAVNQRSGVQQ